MKNDFPPHHWRQRPHRRPPWWPEDETWPPSAPLHLRRRWRRSSRGFFWRAGAVLLLVWILGTAVCAGTIWLIGLLSGQTGGSFSPAIWLPLLLAFILFFALLPGLRRLALPLRDLIDAAQRVQAGDLTPRVRERGPRELRALARAFNSMLDRLLRSERQRRQLLADVTHELRTPVAVLQGNLEGMLDGVYPADTEHLVPLIEETRMLSRLIDDLRTLSLAESGGLVLHREPTDLAVLVGEVLAAFRAQAGASGVALRLEVPDDLPLVEIDPLRIREVLVNLAANALRHTPRGGEVRVAAAINTGRLRLSVVDSGSGIAAEDLPHIFERFYKTVDSPGSGLGLAIARNLVLAHGGEIDAESAPGAGTTVRITLPLDGPAGPAAED
jgi:signal transduction histidine kinase